VNRHLTLLKAFLRDAVRNGELASDPPRFLKKLRENNERVRFLSAAEADRLPDSPEGHKLRLEYDGSISR